MVFKHNRRKNYIFSPTPNLSPFYKQVYLFWSTQWGACEVNNLCSHYDIYISSVDAQIHKCVSVVCRKACSTQFILWRKCLQNTTYFVEKVPTEHNSFCGESAYRTQLVLRRKCCLSYIVTLDSIGGKLTDVIWVWSDYFPLVILRCCTWWSFKKSVVEPVEGCRLNWQYSRGAQFPDFWLTGWLNLLQWRLTFQHNYCSFFPSIPKCVPVHKRQITATFTSRSAIVGPHYGTPFYHYSGSQTFKKLWTCVVYCHVHALM